MGGVRRLRVLWVLLRVRLGLRLRWPWVVLLGQDSLGLLVLSARRGAVFYFLVFHCMIRPMNKDQSVKNMMSTRHSSHGSSEVSYHVVINQLAALIYISQASPRQV